MVPGSEARRLCCLYQSGKGRSHLGLESGETILPVLVDVESVSVALVAEIAMWDQTLPREVIDVDPPRFRGEALQVNDWDEMVPI